MTETEDAEKNEIPLLISFLICSLRAYIYMILKVNHVRILPRYSCININHMRDLQPLGKDLLVATDGLL